MDFEAATFLQPSKYSTTQRRYVQPMTFNSGLGVLHLADSPSLSRRILLPNTTEPDIERLQALADMSRSALGPMLS